MLHGSGTSGTVVVHGGATVAKWGDTSVPEQPVADTVELEVLDTGAARTITWEHLVQQTSQWRGQLWGKPTPVDAPSFREGDEVPGRPPGTGWGYNDVRIKLLTLALTALLRTPLDEVLREAVMEPLGASGRCEFTADRRVRSTLARGGRGRGARCAIGNRLRRDQRVAGRVCSPGRGLAGKGEPHQCCSLQPGPPRA